MNHLNYGDNLSVLRESVDPIHLDPPVKSQGRGKQRAGGIALNHQ